MTPLMLSLFLAGPARAEPVEVVPVGLHDIQLSGGRVQAELLLEVERTGGPPMRLRALDYQLQLDGQTVADATASYGGMRLPKDTVVQVTVPVRIDAASAAGLAWRGITQGRLSVAFEGRAKVWWLLFPVSVPFRQELVDIEVD
ncbi:MAG: LEA type 2 family protein [Alphaproteobacteria bacterium]|nr:LEA type 2 family protein [Alphaproteobacteria bacterium]